MKDLLKKTLLIGIGATYYSKETLEQWWEKLTKEEGINAEEGKKFISELKQKADEFNRKQLADVQEAVKKAIGEMGFATKEDINKLRAEITGNTQQPTN